MTGVEQVTCDTCEQYFFLKPDHLSCYKKIENCIDTGFNASIGDDVCIECEENYVPSDDYSSCVAGVNQCISYFPISAADTTATCKFCEVNLVPSADFTSCVNEIPNCINQTS